METMFLVTLEYTDFPTDVWLFRNADNALECFKDQMLDLLSEEIRYTNPLSANNGVCLKDELDEDTYYYFLDSEGKRITEIPKTLEPGFNFIEFYIRGAADSEIRLTVEEIKTMD